MRQWERRLRGARLPQWNCATNKRICAMYIQLIHLIYPYSVQLIICIHNYQLLCKTYFHNIHFLKNMKLYIQLICQKVIAKTLSLYTFVFPFFIIFFCKFLFLKSCKFIFTTYMHTFYNDLHSFYNDLSEVLICIIFYFLKCYNVIHTTYMYNNLSPQLFIITSTEL